MPPVSRCCCGFYLQTRRKPAPNIYCRRHLAAALCCREGGGEGGGEGWGGEQPSTRCKARRHRHLMAVYSLNIDEYLRAVFTVCVATFAGGGHNALLAAPCSRGYCVIIQCKCTGAAHQFNVRSEFVPPPLLTVQSGCRCCLALSHFSPFRRLSASASPPPLHSINAGNISFSAAVT